MKQGIHPDYMQTKVTCSCGNTFVTRSVKAELHVELCDQCHPFYTGKQKLVDTGGRVERFQKKYAKRARAAGAVEQEEAAAAAEAKAAAVAASPAASEAVSAPAPVEAEAPGEAGAGEDTAGPTTGSE